MAKVSRTALAILRRKQVQREVGLSRPTIYQRIKDGTFPASVRPGTRSAGWRVAGIDRCLASPAGYRCFGPTSIPGPVHTRLP
ncbi:AlpA family phage regulatory protein [Paraburkholderia sp. BL10I2N1]|uniref:helix-turn-helix transcriptional regulator n=1 Tax=Paraburkholderia sp. BL10I2N1 TaxID=1938796 RepID=UPI00105D944E|nr:AlpA family phage regulatory protein [Paraburkholderia sp. BL10I2N1]